MVRIASLRSLLPLHSDAGKPKLVKTLTDFVKKSGGVVGPHTFYAMPERMLITGLSNDRDRGGRTGMVEYTNEGNYLATYWMPTDAELEGAVKSGRYADGYGYDVRGGGLIYLLDASALLAHHRQESGWEEVQEIFADIGAQILIASVSIAEFARRMRELGAGEPDIRETLTDYRVLFSEVLRWTTRSHGRCSRPAAARRRACR